MGTFERLFREPVGKPRFLPVVTWAYMVWAILPVLIAIQFSFNDSRSLTLWSGFTTKWYFSDPDRSGTHLNCATRSSRASSSPRQTS